MTELPILIVFYLVSSNCFYFFFLFAKQNSDISWEESGMDFWESVKIHMSKHGFSINSSHAKIRDGIKVLEWCFSLLGFASCLFSHTSLIPLSESHDKQTLFCTCCKAAWFISSACCRYTGPSSTAELGSGSSCVSAGLDHAAAKRCPGAQGSAGATSAFSNTSTSSRADGLITIKLLWAVTSHGKQELQALGSFECNRSRGPEGLTFTTSQDLLSVAKLYLAALRGSFQQVVFHLLEMLFANFPFLHSIGCGVWFVVFFFITALCTLTAFNTLVAGALFWGAVVLLHSCRQGGGLLMICLNLDPQWNLEGATMHCDRWCPL